MAGKAGLLQFGEKCLYWLTVLSVHGLHELHGLHAIHAVHDKSRQFHGKSNPKVTISDNSQIEPGHDAGPTVYSCGIRGIRAALGRFLHNEKRTHHF